ncbi:unnamed protein product [Rotaria magnacalcarata]
MNERTYERTNLRTNELTNERTNLRTNERTYERTKQLISATIHRKNSSCIQKQLLKRMCHVLSLNDLLFTHLEIPKISINQYN